MEQSTPAPTQDPEASERSLPGAPLPLRVGFAASLAAGLASAVEAVEIGGPQRRQRGPADGPLESVDALVVDRPGTALPPDALRALCERARAGGIPVIGLRRDGEDPAWAGLADLETGNPGSTDELTAAPAVDIGLFNPDLFTPDGVAGYMAALDDDADPAGLVASFALLTAATRFDPVTLRTSAELIDVPLPSGVVAGRDFESDAELLGVLHRRLGVLDHPTFHASEFERAGWIAKLCAAGVPVCAAEISDELAAMLGAELAELLEPLRPRDLADLDRRERASVALRRAALREHSASARWRQIAAAAGLELPARPKVSVILSTRRESWLEHGIAQVARQTYEPRELVVCLHGDEFAPGTSERIRSLYGGDCKVIRVDGELTLGDALNAGVEASAGELVTKMDDDDYYSTEHLWDLVLALEYSGADLVGKAAEFVYLEEIDVTVRQISHDVDTRMAGGGMMAVKGPLQAIGGWPQRSRAEDLYLIRRFTGAGRPIRRIPPHGYILNRHGVDHTWRPQVDYFLFRSERQWRGLGFGVTAIDAPTDPYTRIPPESEVR
jgi:Glycosyl transferase family 2